MFDTFVFNLDELCTWIVASFRCFSCVIWGLFGDFGFNGDEDCDVICTRLSVM